MAMRAAAFSSSSNRMTPRAGSVRAAASAKYVTYVKGDPKTSTLGDCPFCQRVLLTLETKGAHYDLAYVDFADKPKWLVDKFEGKVPVIEEGPSQMNDSDKIVVWLEEQIPQPAMAAETPEAAMKLFPAFRGWMLCKPEEEAEKKAAFVAALDALETTLAAVPGPFLGGLILNAVDAALAPKLYHALTATRHFKGFDVYATPASYPAIKKYRLALSELPAWKKTDYGQEAIIQGWTKALAAAK